MNIFKKTLAIVLALGTFSCGTEKKEEKKDTFNYEQPQTETAKTGASEEKSNTVLLLGDDMMKFNLREIRVKAGEKVTLTLRHTGKLDVKVMGHNFVLLKQGIDIVTFATAANSAADTEYIPNGGADVIAHTKMIGGGQETTIEFDPPAPGTYKFLCSFPGHYGMMQGDFIVE